MCQLTPHVTTPATWVWKVQAKFWQLVVLPARAVRIATPRPPLQQCSLGPLAAVEAENRNATTPLAHTLCMCQHRDTA